MASMDIFNQNPFGMFELTRGLENLPFRPGLIRSLGLFQYRGIRTKQFGIESRNGVLSLIDFSDPDAPATQENNNGEERTLRDFRTRHFKKEATVRASEVAGIRAFGSETEMMQVQAEISRKGLKLRNDAELTFEFHSLNALQGKVLRTNGSTVVYNWYTEFGITPAAEIDFDLDNANPAKGALRKKCMEVIESMEEDLDGLAPGNLSVEALCGKAFWNDLISHPNVMEAYIFAAKVAEQQGIELTVFNWGGIVWRRYRGGSGVAVDTDKCVIYPTGIDGLFEQYGSPAETFEFVNTPGVETYYRIIQDKDRNAWIKLELEANPMFVCTRPKVLRTGKRT